MIGKLDPEENVMDETVSSNRKSAAVMKTVSTKLAETIATLGWDCYDDVVVEIGGTAVSGIHQAEGVNPKWSRQFGERVYNKEAFIVIKNRTRSPVISSKPMEETNEEGSEG